MTNTTNQTAADQPDAAQRHRLLGKKIMSVQYDTWEAWETRFDAELAKDVPYADALIGLLHRGFDAQATRAEAERRIQFYLEIADGYRSVDNFYNNLTDSGLAAEMRQSVATKAMKVLVDRLFASKYRSENGRQTGWANWICNPAVFEKLLWFFDPKRSSNIPRERGENRVSEVILAFLKDFTKLPFDPHSIYDLRVELSAEIRDETRRMFSAAAPQMMEILDEQGRLTYLLGWDLRFTANGLLKLREIALRKSPSSKERVYRTIEDAYADDQGKYNGGAAAGVLILLRVRLKKTRLAEAARKKAEKQLVSLQA